MRDLVAVVLMVVLFPVSAFAQDPPITTFPPGDDKIVALKQGDQAPYSGQLFDTNTALRWGNWMQQYKVRLKLDVDSQKALDKAQIDFLTKDLDLERTQYKLVTDDYAKRLQAAEEEARNPVWYRTPAFGATLGVLGTVAAVVCGIYIVKAGSK